MNRMQSDQSLATMEMPNATGRTTKFAIAAQAPGVAWPGFHRRAQRK